MRTLLIDNYDSFTYNLFQLLAEVNGVEPVVVRNDQSGWEELARGRFDAVVLSPGPGRPDREADFGVCAEAIARCEAPLLGVCLGHQGIGLACGGAVEPAPEPVHGRLSPIVHSGSPLFAGIPRRFEAVRYHSLCLARPLPPALEEIAWTDDGVPMAVAHRDRPQWGVQFHPESVATEHGRRLIENFHDLARPGRKGGRVDFATSGVAKSPQVAALAGRLELKTRRLDGPHDAERVFAALYAESRDAFWLDSSRTDGGSCFSFMGDASGPLGATVAYDVAAREVTVRRRGSDGSPAVEIRAETIFDYLDRELERLRPLAAGLPFDFACGFAGYLGYELKADCGGEPAHESPLPDAAFVFADRMLAFDHESGEIYLLCLVGDGGGEDAGAWLGEVEALLAELDDDEHVRDRDDGVSPTSIEVGEEGLSRSRRRYLDDIAACARLLRAGETYEVCLTNTATAAFPGDPLDLYRALRRVNPAPFSAYFRSGDLAVLSSSPERFLKVDRGRGVEAKPVKGTSRRGATAAEDAALAAGLRGDPKSRAENLMIADLLRNDLGSVCEVGSVHVPALFEVESFETVHQLVSTVRGRLRPELGALDAVRACFPPGSMTGAPKRRTMRILDELEGEARGVYSGAIGYLGLGGGCDFAVSIRTIVLHEGLAAAGAGGAIVVGSEPEAEYEEMLLKAAAPMRALAAVAAAEPA